MIRNINVEDLHKYIKQAKQSGLVFCNNTNYYGLFENGIMIGFTGILPYKNKWVFKNSFVFEQYRRRGYHKEMMNFRLELAKKNNIKKVEATCTNMSINNYLSFGFQICKKYKIYTKVYLNL